MSWYVNSLWAQAGAAATAQGSIPWFVNLLVAVATLAISFFLGGYLGKKLRMRDHGWKIGLCLFSLLASVVVLLMGPPLKLGIDLSGGVILVYEVDQAKLKQTENQKVDMDKLIEAVTRRVNPGGQKEVVIRKYGAQQIEVIVPEVEQAEVDRIKRIISTTGNLEFRILSNQRNDKELIERALAEPSKVHLYDAENHLQAWWAPVKEGEEHSFDGYREIARRTRKVGDREITEILVNNDIYNVTGGYLTKAEAGTDRRGRPCVNFTFNSAGGQLFGQLTSTHLPEELIDFTYKLGILLDGQLYSAPSIQSTITDRGEITGSFTQQEVQELVNVLNAGSLPVALSKEPVSELFSGPTLGQDTIEKSTKAMLIAAVLVPLFMLWYYRFSGLVADIALTLNMLMLFAIMLTIKAAFTLTGFAGLALTVGMAVDNNVLIYERLREELERGATLRMAIRNAFQRASAVIIDANLTTLLAATVLYVIGSDQVKGFAVTLWLGVAISMYTAVFVSRVIFDVAEKRQWITRVKMLRLIGRTNIDFMSWFRYTLPVSLLIIVLAIAASIHRGKGLFDIDFTGGVSVQALFNAPQDTAEVRRLLSNKLPDLAISDVQLAGEAPGLRFVVNTSEQEMGKVRGALSEVFGDKLKRNAARFSAPVMVEKPSAEAEEKPVAKQQDAAVKEKAESAAPVEAAAGKTAPRRPSPGAEAEKTPAAKPAADPFAGGSRSELTFAEPVNHETALQMLRAAMDALQISPDETAHQIGNDRYVEGDHTAYKQWTLKIMLPVEKTQALLTTLERQAADSPIFPASNTIGAAVAGNTRMQAVYALVASWLCMIVYLWIRFQGVAFGLAAVASLVHDIFIILGAGAVSVYAAPYLGFLMIEPFKINLPIVAAFLTIIGYTVNDTIVVFDRIREVRGKNPDLTRQMVNASTNQTLSRTILTSLTVFLVVIVLYLFGGEAVHGFAFALIIGVLTGTYSSIYIAAPILLWLVGRREQSAA